MYMYIYSTTYMYERGYQIRNNMIVLIQIVNQAECLQ